jgi:pimeloyl-ACP methyl ester carboxylesterase
MPGQLRARVPGGGITGWLAGDGPPVLVSHYVIGHSWGGHLAMHLAVRHPDRVLGLVIADPLGAVSDGGAGSPARREDRRGLADRSGRSGSRLTAGGGAPVGSR